MKFIFIILVSLTIQRDTLSGFWMLSTNDLIVQCYKVNGAYYGKIHWFKDDDPSREKYSENGLPKSKWKGYVVMSNFTYVDGRLSGKIFDVKNGEEYDAYLDMEHDTITVTSYVLLPIFSKKIKFRRYNN